VLVLTPEALSACGAGGDSAAGEAPQQPQGTGGASLGPDAGTAAGASLNDGTGGAAGAASTGSAGAPATTPLPFEPSPVEGEIYTNWRGNTVDPQDLTNILASWSLTVDGLVAQPIVLSFAELMQLRRQDQVTDFHCVEGWSVLDVPWNGVHIDTLIELVQPDPAATHVTFHCVGDVYSESLPLDVARERYTLLAYGIGGNTLPLTHGFPLRLVVPRLYGYKSAKWVNRISFTNEAEQGYWVQRGYPYEAEVPASRLREGKY
jgi:DMSO/TMAO reductase YedYZ molybdopterin-dependent catalytic subunit